MRGTEEQRQQVRELALDGMRPAAIAIRLGLSSATVCNLMDEQGIWRPREGETRFLMGEPPDWMEGAVCPQTDPEVFFPATRGDGAKRICMGCDVRVECLEYALEHDERFGIWGGKSERERRKIRKQRMTESLRGEASGDRAGTG